MIYSFIFPTLFVFEYHFTFVIFDLYFNFLFPLLLFPFSPQFQLDSEYFSLLSLTLINIRTSLSLILSFALLFCLSCPTSSTLSVFYFTIIFMVHDFSFGFYYFHETIPFFVSQVFYFDSFQYLTSIPLTPPTLFSFPLPSFLFHTLSFLCFLHFFLVQSLYFSQFFHKNLLSLLNYITAVLYSLVILPVPRFPLYNFTYQTSEKTN